MIMIIIIIQASLPTPEAAEAAAFRRGAVPASAAVARAGASLNK